MPERASLNQLVQIAPETTPGTPAGSGFKTLSSLSIETGIEADVRVHRAYGHKYASLATLGKEWSSASLSGQAVYTELVYPLCGLLKNVTPVQLMDGATPTGAYMWVFDPASLAEDAIKTFTVEQGSAVRAHRFAYGLFNGLTLDFSRDGVDVSGSMIGQRITDGVTMTGGASQLELIPVLGKSVDVHLDSSWATFSGGTPTKLTRALRAGWKLDNRFGQVWPLDSAQNSFAAHVEVAPTAEMTLLHAADAAGMALLDALRVGETRYYRIKAVGPIIYDTAGTANDRFHELMIEAAVKVKSVDRFSDEDGLYAIGWTFELVEDTNFAGSAYKITVINKLTGL